MESTPKQDEENGITKGLKLQTILEHQPFWDEYRDTARECYDVFDGDVISPEFLEYAREIGMPTRRINLVKKTIMAVAGQSEKLQTQVKVRPNMNDAHDSAEALDYLLQTNWRMTKTNKAIKKAHLDQLVGGIGWVNVRRNFKNRLAQRYVVEHVPWNEMKWDTYSMRRGFENCRWVAREMRYPLDVLEVNMPKHKALLHRIENGWHDGEFDSLDDHYWDQGYIYDEETRMVVVREAYERVPEVRELARLEDGTLVEWREGIRGDKETARVEVIKKSLWAGPSKVWYADHECAHPAFLPMIAYTKDRTNVPVGPVYDMVDPMYTYNSVLNEQLHILATNKIFVKPDMLHEDYDLEEEDNALEIVRQETLRRDGALAFSKNADLSRDIVIHREWENLTNLQSMKHDSRDEIRDVSGINQAMSGDAEAYMSGKAMDYSAQLGSTNMAPIISNKRDAEMWIAESLQEMQMSDIGDSFAEVPVKSAINGRERIIPLNATGQDGQISNRLSQSKMHLAMDSIETSAGYMAGIRNELQTTMGQLTNSKYIDNFAKLYIKNLDIPGAQEELEKINMMSGTPETPEELAQQMEANSKQQQEQAEMDKEAFMADVGLKKAQAAYNISMAETNQAAARKTLEEAEQLDATPTVDLEKVRLKIEEAKLALENKKLEVESQKIASDERAAKLEKLSQFGNVA